MLRKQKEHWGTNLDTTSSQNDGNNTYRWARPILLFFFRISLMDGGNWRTAAASEWIDSRASSWRTYTVSSILTLGSGCSPAIVVWGISKMNSQDKMNLSLSASKKYIPIKNTTHSCYLHGKNKYPINISIQKVT